MAEQQKKVNNSLEEVSTSQNTRNLKRKAIDNEDPTTIIIIKGNCFSDWNSRTLRTLGIVSDRNNIWSPVVLFEYAFSTNLELLNNLKSFKDRIMHTLSPLTYLDVDKLEDIDCSLPFTQGRTWDIDQIKLEWNSNNEPVKLEDKRLYHKFYVHGEQFAEQLVHMSLTKKCNGKLTKGMYQNLFQHFSGLFGLMSVASPSLENRCVNIRGTNYNTCTDIIFPCLHKVEKERQVVAICKVKEEVVDIDQNDGLQGQFGAELLTYFPSSVRKHGILGMIVQETKVTFSFFSCSNLQYEEIVSGDQDCVLHPSIQYTRPYNFLKASDRKEIIDVLLILGCIQNQYQ